MKFYLSSSGKQIVYLLMVSFLSLIAMGGKAQQMLNTTPKQSFKDRIYVGGNAGAQFGNVVLIDIGPMVGYRITEKFSAGLGARYIYLDQPRVPFSQAENIYGGSVFTRMDIYQGLFGYSEFEVLNRSVGIGERRDVASWFVGGGYSQPLGTRAGMSVMLLYNLTETADPIYKDNPILRVGFGVGL